MHVECAEQYNWIRSHFSPFPGDAKGLQLLQSLYFRKKYDFLFRSGNEQNNEMSDNKFIINSELTIWNDEGYINVYFVCYFKIIPTMCIVYVFDKEWLKYELLLLIKNENIKI